MLTIIIGTPGSGKSYEAVTEYVFPALEQGRLVRTNLPLNIPEFAKVNAKFPSLIEVLLPEKNRLYPFRDFSDYDCPWFDKDKGIGPLYVIDEAHLALPPKETNARVKEFFALHRHKSADIVLMTQSWNSIDRDIRGLCEYCISLQKNRSFGSSKSYVKKIRSKDKRGAVIGGVQLKQYKKQYFPFYSSYTLGGASEADLKQPTIWHHWSFKMAGVAVVAALCLVLKSGLHLFPDARASTKVEKHADTLPAPSPSAASVPSAASAQAKASDPFSDFRFYIAGEISLGRDRTLMVYGYSKDSPSISRFTQENFFDAGYIVKVFGECSMRISFYDGKNTVNRFITCAAPPVAHVAFSQPQSWTLPDYWKSTQLSGEEALDMAIKAKSLSQPGLSSSPPPVQARSSTITVK